MQGRGLQAEGRARAKGRVAPPGQAEELQGQVSGTRWAEWERRGRLLGSPEGFGFYSDQDGSWAIPAQEGPGWGTGVKSPSGHGEVEAGSPGGASAGFKGMMGMGQGRGGALGHGGG